MRLFKKQSSSDPAPPIEPAEAPEPPSLLLTEETILLRLSATVATADAATGEFVVICLAPQLLPGQVLTESELPVAVAVMERHLRPSDYVGRLGAERFLAVLPDTAEKPGHVVTHRMATELTVRSTRFNHRKWFGGYATFPADGLDARRLAEVAAANARARPTAPPPMGDERRTA